MAIFFFRLFTYIFGSVILFSCHQKIIEKKTLYSRLGGEKVLVALSLKTTRNDLIKNKFEPQKERIFRQRLTEWLCYETSGPCNFPNKKEFFLELGLNLNFQEKLIKVIEESMDQTNLSKKLKLEVLERLNY